MSMFNYLFGLITYLSGTLIITNKIFIFLNVKNTFQMYNKSMVEIMHIK